MMIRSNHIKRMISFEQTASDPKRLFQPSFRLVDEEKFRRRAYPTLLKLEESLIAAIKQFETENGEQFMYDGVPYIETLQSEVSKRHVNKTVFAKFTPKIVAPTKGQAIQIMGRSFSPIPVPTTPTQVSRPQKTSKSSLTSTHLVSSPSGPSLKTNKSKISPPQPSSMPDSLSTLSIHESQLLDPVKNKNKEQKLKLGLSDDFSSLKSYLLSHQRGISDVSTESLGSNDSVEAKSSAFSLSMTPASVSSSASNSPTTETTANNSSGSYFGSPISSTTTSPASSVSAVVSLLSTSPPAPTSLTKQQQVARLQRLEQLALPKNKLNAVAKRPQANNTAKRVAA
ncbi:hypothetical protein BX616_010543 [Lobosporangium transversale]|nr:hypothetical protein BX616_010543 [Lobosporangium transversale]